VPAAAKSCSSSTSVLIRRSPWAKAHKTTCLPSVEEQSAVGFFFHGIIGSHLKNGSLSTLQESGISQEQ
jgi:hypothetical protein